MHISVAARVPAEVGAVVHLLPKGADLPDGVAAAAATALGFDGSVDRSVTLPPSGDGDPVLILVGVGSAGESTDLVGASRRAVAAAVRGARRHGTLAVVPFLPDGADRVAIVEAVAQGAALGAYRFDRYKSTTSDDAAAGNGEGKRKAKAKANANGQQDALTSITIVSSGGKRVADACARGVSIADAQCLARDLVNEPGGSLTPAAFAEIAVEVAEREDLTVTVMDLDDIEAAGLGGVLGVNRGSTQPARFVVLGYEPANHRGTLALVGKGVTFDAGGLSVKPADGMMTMKMDMAGAAAVLAAFSAFGSVGVRCRVIGFIPLTDNMLGGDATRPGDVLRMRNGTTVEVLNTDAEGRLILADALSLASEESPDAIIDLATLTGAVDIALGPGMAGLMGNHEGWLDAVREAATASGERVWPLPLPDDYRRWLDSDVADLRNISRQRSAGTITAGLFLSRFVADGIPWAHVDIAATAWSGETRGTDVPGGTGYGVRLLIELARSFSKPR